MTPLYASLRETQGALNLIMVYAINSGALTGYVVATMKPYDHNDNHNDSFTSLVSFILVGGFPQFETSAVLTRNL